MESADSGNVYRMDMILNLPKSPSTLQYQNPDGMTSAVNKISKTASTLESAGLPKTLVSAALDKGQAGYLDLYFMPYEKISLDEIGGVN